MTTSFALLAATLAGLWAAGWADLIRVGGPGGTDLGDSRFAAVLVWFFSAAMACHFSPGRRIPILLGASLVQLMGLHGPLRAGIALILWSIFYLLVRIPNGSRLRRAGIVIFLAAAFAGPWLAWRAGAPALVTGILTTMLFGTGFLLRSILYAYEATVKREQLGKAGYMGFLTYLIALPFGIVHWQPVGFMVLHRGLRAATDPLLLRKGVKQVSLATLYLLAHHAGRRHGMLLSHPEALAMMEQLNMLTVIAAAWSVFLGLFLQLAGQVHLTIGMMRVLGFDIPAGFNAPLTSRNILEFWRRWNTYFRDFVMTLVYYPVAAALKRRPLLAVAIGSAFTFILSGSAHALIDIAGFPSGASPDRLLGRHGLFLVFGGLVAVWMMKKAASARRRRGTRRGSDQRAGPGSLLLHAGSAAFTLTVFALLYLIFRRPLAGAMTETLEAMIRFPF